MVTLRHLQAFAKNKENLRPSERTDENTGIFCDAEYISNLFFYEYLKLFVPVDQVLVLVAMAGKNVFDERLRRRGSLDLPARRAPSAHLHRTVGYIGRHDQGCQTEYTAGHPYR